MKRTTAVVLFLLISLVVLPLSAGAEAPGRSNFELITQCYPVGAGTSFEVCVHINPITDCDGWELGPVPPMGYQIHLTDNIYPYGHSLGIAYWGPQWLSGTWTDDKVQETFLWQNAVNVGIPALGVWVTIPVSIAIVEPATCGPRVAICHHTHGSVAFREIVINRNALDVHLAHGDFLPDPMYGCELP